MKKNKLIGLFFLSIMVINSLLFFFFGTEKQSAILLVTSSLISIGLVWFILVFSENKNAVNSSIRIINLPSIIFNNTKSFNIITIIILCITFLFLWYSRFVDSLIIYAISSVFLIVFAILISPKKMVLNQHELIYDKYWKEKWENIKEYKIYDDVLKIETKNNHTHTVKKIDSESLVIIEKIFTEKQIVKK